MACVAFFDMTSIDTVNSTDKKNLNSNLNFRIIKQIKEKRKEKCERERVISLLKIVMIIKQSTS